MKGNNNMKLIQYAAAYAALLTLDSEQLSAQDAYNIVRLKRLLAPKAQDFQNSEQALIERYGAKLPDGRPDIRGGRLMFAGADEDEKLYNGRAYDNARRELCAVEDDEELPRFELHFPADAKITPAALEALDSVSLVIIDAATV